MRYPVEAICAAYVNKFDGFFSGGCLVKSKRRLTGIFLTPIHFVRNDTAVLYFRGFKNEDKLSPPKLGGVPDRREGGVVCYEARFVLKHTTPRLLRRRTPPDSGGETYTRGLLPNLNLIHLFFGLIRKRKRKTHSSDKGRMRFC